MRMLGVYADFAETELALPVVRGEKTAAERFAGRRCRPTASRR